MKDVRDLKDLTIHDRSSLNAVVSKVVWHNFQVLARADAPQA